MTGDFKQSLTFDVKKVTLEEFIDEARRQIESGVELPGRTLRFRDLQVRALVYQRK